MTGWAAEKFANVSISVGERVAGLFGLHLSDEGEDLREAQGGSGSGTGGEAAHAAVSLSEPPHQSKPQTEEKYDEIFDINDADLEATKADTNRDTKPEFVLVDSTSASSAINTPRHTPALVDEATSSPSTWETTKLAATSLGGGISEGCVLG